jgi:hypothetical protein
MLLLAVGAAACSGGAVEEFGAAPVGALPGQVSVSSPYGIVITGVPPAQRGGALDAARDSGVGWVRYTAYWYLLQPTGAAFDNAALNDLKDLVQQARVRGLNVFMTIEGTPAWAQLCNVDPFAGCGESRYPPHDNNWVAWINFLKGMGANFSAYPHDVQAWGIWNEPNDPASFQVRAGRDPVEEYKKFLWYGVAELRSYGGRIVAPEVGQDGNMFTWVQRVLQTEAHRFDVISVHQYNTAGCTEKDMVRLQNIVTPYGKEIWLTEDGYRYSSAIGQTRHTAGILDEMLDGYANNTCWNQEYNQAYPGDARWHKTFVYHLYWNDAAFPETHLGTLSSWGGFTPKPAYHCVKWYAGGMVGTRPADCWRDVSY